MPVKYSRAKPSARYERLVAQYREMHREGEQHLGIPPDETFPGKSLLPQAPRIKRLIKVTGAGTILDYGSGKGQQYRPLPFTDETGSVHVGIPAWWGVQVQCYDPAYPPFSARPQGQFDGVICTDVLEHCPEDDMPWILEEIFAYATRFVFANVACFPARKRLPNGQNAHCTVRPPKWWRALIEAAHAKHPEILYEFRVQYIEHGPQGERRAEKLLTNAEEWNTQRSAVAGGDVQ